MNQNYPPSIVWMPHTTQLPPIWKTSTCFAKIRPLVSTKPAAPPCCKWEQVDGGRGGDWSWLISMFCSLAFVMDHSRQDQESVE